MNRASHEAMVGWFIRDAKFRRRSIVKRRFFYATLVVLLAVASLVTA